MADFQTTKTQYKVSDFVAWQRDGALQLNPNFQRRPVWKKGAKSFLIDTILKDLPMPIIFLRELPTDLKTLKTRRDVVDGQQRIRTILSFIDPSLVPNYDAKQDEFTIDKIHNEELAGKRFRDLSAKDKQQIMDYHFSVHIFPSNTDDRDILQIFARMNSTGVKLNAQELRNAEFWGYFKTTAYRLATEQLNRWRDWRIFNPNQIARMNEVELTSEFMMLILDGVLEKNNTTISNYYERYERQFPDEAEVTRRFRTVFETIAASFPTDVMTNLFRNKTIFFALFSATYAIQYGIRQMVKKPDKLTKEKPRPLKNDIIQHMMQAAGHLKAGNVPQKVMRASRGATAHASQRKIIISYLAGPNHDPF